jgi:hypothetical protein
MAFSAPLIGTVKDLFGCQSFSFGLALTLASFPIFPPLPSLIAIPGIDTKGQHSFLHTT